MQRIIKEIREIKPLILNLTNSVTTEFVANVLLAIGAAPIMSECQEELEELIEMSASININIGTLNEPFIALCMQALDLAHKYKKPVVLDPVGAGATVIRTKSAQNLLAKGVDILKGNASEIMALWRSRNRTLGVEATNTVTEAKSSAQALAVKYNITVAVSGAMDFITNSRQEKELGFGAPIMASITGMGCTLAATIAAFRAVHPDSFTAAAKAIEYFGLCGEKAQNSSSGPGSFRLAFLDALYNS